MRGLLPAGIREFDAVSGSPILQFSGPWSKTFVMSFLAGQETTYGRESERWRRRRRRRRICARKGWVYRCDGQYRKERISRGVTSSRVSQIRTGRKAYCVEGGRAYGGRETEELGSLSTNALSLHKLTISSNKSCAFVYGEAEKAGGWPPKSRWGGIRFPSTELSLSGAIRWP